MEIETLGALRTLKPGECSDYEERWDLKVCDDTFDPRDNADIDRFVEDNSLNKGGLSRA